jgi:hypothetical protein
VTLVDPECVVLSVYDRSVLEQVVEERENVDASVRITEQHRRVASVRSSGRARQPRAECMEDKDQRRSDPRQDASLELWRVAARRVRRLERAAISVGEHRAECDGDAVADARTGDADLDSVGDADAA